jgi:hypothetical protein
LKNDYSPIKAIHQYCVVTCCAGQPKPVEQCPVEEITDPDFPCSLHPFRLGKYPQPKKSPLKAIKIKCMDCSAGERKRVKNCQKLDCPLFPFRLGHNPARKGIGRFSRKRQEHQKAPSQCVQNEGIAHGT